MLQYSAVAIGKATVFKRPDLCLNFVDLGNFEVCISDYCLFGSLLLASYPGLICSYNFNVKVFAFATVW